MSGIDLFKKRRSARAFQEKPIAKSVLEDIVDAARLAPTARNVQPWEFVVVTGKAILKDIAAITDHGKFIANAGACILVFCADTKYYLEDGCAATENILLAAAALGLGACWVAADKKAYCDRINSLFSAPGSFKLVSMVAIGYLLPGEENNPVQKRGLEEVIHWEKF
ncbi:MAG: nitroreductase family protein [Candidatus Omnitrophica bacterium]|jgi:nitroreductase|nr:nitroreductase family protein [Candidatus Omnitrophota bacterium]MDD5079322.1 nitroreductase family protein [Candidatus Omnitrophota bacterium]